MRERKSKIGAEMERNEMKELTEGESDGRANGAKKTVRD